MAKVKMRKVGRYSNEFKITAIRLASLPGALIQDVAKVLDIHPFMLSRWKKEYREGKIKGDPHPDLEKLTEVEEKVSEQSRIRELERALKKAQIENDLLKKNHPIQLRTKAQVFAFIDRHHPTYELRFLCCHYGVSRSGYYAWKERPMSEQMKANRDLLRQILTIHQESHETYGSPRVWKALKKGRHGVRS